MQLRKRFSKFLGIQPKWERTMVQNLRANLRLYVLHLRLNTCGAALTLPIVIVKWNDCTVRSKTSQSVAWSLYLFQLIALFCKKSNWRWTQHTHVALVVLLMYSCLVHHHRPPWLLQSLNPRSRLSNSMRKPSNARFNLLIRLPLLPTSSTDRVVQSRSHQTLLLRVYRSDNLQW